MGVSCSFIYRSWMTGFCTILGKNKNTSLIPQWPSLHLMSGSLWTFTSLLLASLCYVRNSWCLSTSVTATPADDELNCGNCVHVHVKACCSWYCRLPLCPAAFGFQSSLNCLPICELESLLLLLRLLRHLPYSYRLMPEQGMMATEDLWTSLPLWRWYLYARMSLSVCVHMLLNLRTLGSSSHMGVVLSQSRLQFL